MPLVGADTDGGRNPCAQEGDLLEPHLAGQRSCDPQGGLPKRREANHRGRASQQDFPLRP